MMHAVPEQATFAEAGQVDEAPGAIAHPDRIRAWLSIAKAGEEMVYCSRRTMGLPQRSEGAALVRELAAKGLVHPFQRTIDGVVGQKNYVIRRSLKALPSPRPKTAAAPHPPRIDAEAAAINALFPLLKRHARFGRPCPTNAQLGKLTKIPLCDVEPTLRAMEQMGMIRINGVSAPTLRLVTIVETGHRTGIIG